MRYRHPHFHPHAHGEDAAGDRGSRWFLRGGRGFGRHGDFGGRGRGRGDLKYEILAVLVDGPRHGYDIMDEIERRESRRPSPGSVYPALQMLADGDFVTSTEQDGKRVYAVTDKGRTLLSERPTRGDDEADAGADLFIRGAQSMRALFGAAQQVARSGDREVMERAITILDGARRELYTLLAEIG